MMLPLNKNTLVLGGGLSGMTAALELAKQSFQTYLVEKDAKLEDVLTITLKDVMGRRLQTLVFKKNLARSVKQARQFINHNHIYVAGKNITSPSYLVSREEEPSISFGATSALSNPDHPERAVEEKKPVKKAEEKKKSPKKKPAKKKTTKKSDKKEEKKEEKSKEEKPKEAPKEEKKEVSETQSVSDDAQKASLSDKPKKAEAKPEAKESPKKAVEQSKPEEKK